MQLNTYLSFKGDCEAALQFYARCLDGKVGTLFRYAGSPMENQAPPGWGDKIMHGSFTAAGVEILASDVVPEQYQEPRGFSLSLHIKGTPDTERIFHALAQCGRVV